VSVVELVILKLNLVEINCVNHHFQVAWCFLLCVKYRQLGCCLCYNCKHWISLLVTFASFTVLFCCGSVRWCSGLLVSTNAVAVHWSQLLLFRHVHGILLQVDLVCSSESYWVTDTAWDALDSDSLCCLGKILLWLVRWLWSCKHNAPTSVASTHDDGMWPVWPDKELWELQSYCSKHRISLFVGLSASSNLGNTEIDE